MPFSKDVIPLSADNRVYHLALLPDDIADTVITVGDQGRVEKVSRHFDKIEHEIQHREFLTHTGIKDGKRLSVISTGIGTSNIDIVLNELDVLKNVDLKTRETKKDKTSLTIVRLGTTGGISSDITLGDVVVTESAIGLDGLLNYYIMNQTPEEAALQAAFNKHMGPLPISPYATFAARDLVSHFARMGKHGITITSIGFYGPQDRVLRIPLAYQGLTEKLSTFVFKGQKVLNYEMETAAILGLGRLLGHQALSLAVVLADRSNGTFAKNPETIVDEMIEQALHLLVTV